MASEWREVRLGELADEITVGHVGPMPAYVEGGIPFLRSQNVDRLRINDSDLKSIGFSAHDRLRKSALHPGDVVIVRTGRPGACAVIPTSLPVANCSDLVIVRPGRELDPWFLAYYINSAAVHGVSSQVVGAVQQHFNIGSARNLTIRLPDLATQREVVEILRALDDKIELNRRMSQTLESMARALFKSWFVDFDPVHAKAECRDTFLPGEIAGLFSDSFEDSEFGEIPSGWGISSLGQLCDRITDGSHSSPASVARGRPMASVKDMRRWGFDVKGCRQISELDYLRLVRDDCRPRAGDVLIAKDGSFLKHIFVAERDLDLVVLSSVAILRPNIRIDPHLLAFSLLDDATMGRMSQYVSGAVLQRIVLKDFRQIPMLVPPIGLQRAWAMEVTPMIRRCWRHLDESDVLESMRDAIIPSLISGRLTPNDAGPIGEATPL